MLILVFKETKLNTKTFALKNIEILKPLMMLVHALQNKNIRNIIFVGFLFVLGWSVYMQFIALHLFQKYNFTSMQIGYFVGWIGIFMSISMLFLIRLMVRFFSTIQILFSGILLSIVGIVIAIFHVVTVEWISAIPIACGMGLAYNTIITLFSDSVSPDLQGWIMGVSASIMAAAAGIGGIITGIVANNGFLAFISIILLWILCFSFAFFITPNRKTAEK